MPFPIFDTLDAVPESFRNDYEERDGKWHPKVEDTEALNSALATERARREAAEKLSSKTAAALKKLENEKKAGEAGLTSEQLEKVRLDVRAELEAEYAPLKARAETAEANHRKIVLDSAVQAMFTKAGVIDPVAAWKVTGDRFELTTDGKPILKDSPTANLETYIAGAMKKEFAWMFTGTQADGGGAPGSTGKAPAAPAGIDPLANPGAALQAARAAGATQ